MPPLWSGCLHVVIELRKRSSSSHGSTRPSSCLDARRSLRLPDVRDATIPPDHDATEPPRAVRVGVAVP